MPHREVWSEFCGHALTLLASNTEVKLGNTADFVFISRHNALIYTPLKPEFVNQHVAGVKIGVAFDLVDLSVDLHRVPMSNLLYNIIVD